MSRILSVLKRLPDNELAQDLASAVVICAFIAAAGYGLAGVSTMVAVARALP